MSGSFYTLNQKYSTLLALELSGAGGGGGTLQTVTDAGNTTTNTIIVDNGVGDYSLVGSTNFQQVSSVGAFSNNIDSTGVNLNILIIGGDENALLNQNSLTFTETQNNFPLPDTFQTNSLTKGQLRLETNTDVLELTTDDILINTVGGANGQYLAYNSGLKWIQPFQSGIIGFDPLLPETNGQVAFPNAYSQVNPPQVFLSFNNNNTTTFINYAVKKIDADFIIPNTWIGFTWEISVSSTSLPDMTLSWLSFA
jgi:hypothetical protein